MYKGGGNNAVTYTMKIYREDSMCKLQDELSRIWSNITPPNSKVKSLLATSYKGVASNGMPVYVELRAIST